MNRLFIAAGLMTSVLLGACQKEGLTQWRDAGVDGTSGVGGESSAGGSVGAGGLGAGGASGVGGSVALGGTVATGGIGVGGVQQAGGAVGSGGLTVGSGGTGSGGLSAAGGQAAAGGATGTGGNTAAMCGGIAGLPCPTGQFCEYVAGTCGKTDASGTCASPAKLCPSLFSPVCGCDGKTYANDCTRQAAKVSKASQGACPASTPCPASIDQIAGWPCTEGLTCQYGTDPRPVCNPSATCSNGNWSRTLPDCAALPPVTCPATREAAAGQACPTQGAYCSYDGLACECTNCSTGPVSLCTGAPTWHCVAPNADASCPAAMPLLGTSCTTEGKTCTYACGAGNARTCKQGAWYSANGGACPVSSRRAKKDIVYLSEAERQRVASDITRLKLATYEYRDPALAGKRHLGFIIEDVPGSPAVDRDGNMVDVYGYASMLVAAVQEQAQEIANLKTEIARLKQRSTRK